MDEMVRAIKGLKDYKYYGCAYYICVCMVVGKRESLIMYGIYQRYLNTFKYGKTKTNREMAKLIMKLGSEFMNVHVGMLYIFAICMYYMSLIVYTINISIRT